MSKFLFYLALLLVLGATVLAFFNERRLEEIISSKESIIQKQCNLAADVKKELTTLQESVAAQASVQEENKKAARDAQEAQAKATHDLKQAQQELADRAAELVQVKGDFAVRIARVQELEAAVQFLSQPKEASKSKNSSSKEGGTHAEVKKESPKTDLSSKEIGASFQEGKVVAINTTWNFVVIGIGSKEGIAAGVEISIKRNEQVIAKAKVTSVEASTSVADLVMSTLVVGTTVQVGDQVFVSERDMGK